ncbi:MAG: Omp28-related outer membrane protein, partial [Bacteroidales bacterium]|nr:Omp28-related outer membrane protein [Bacteroidales bacterium]
MKTKVLLLTVLFVVSSAVVSAQVTDTIVLLTPSNRNVLLEAFTAKGCAHCADGHRIANELAAANPGRVNVINIHEGGYTSNTYTTEFGSELRNQSGLTGYPQGTVNRHLFSGTATAMNRGDWTNKANQIMAMPSPVNIAAEGTLDTRTRTVNIRVQLYYTADQTVTTNSLNIAIIQDNVLGPQNGGSAYNPTQMVGDQYRHTKMLRHLIAGQWGDTIQTISQGTLVEKTYQYVIPEQLGSPNPIDAVLEDLRFIAFVCEGHQEVLTSIEVPVQIHHSFTVADGTQSNSKSPIYTGYTDYFTRNQVIYPASMLSDMEGSEISAITFHLKTLPQNPWTCVFEAKLKTVNEDQFYNTSYYSTDNLPASYTGTVTVASDNTLTINLDTSFVYNGGNLLLELATTVTGVNRTANFYGITSTNGSLRNYNSYSGGAYITSGTRENFIPKTSFTFTWLDTCSPRHLEVAEVAGSSAFVTWQQGHSMVPHPYEVSYRAVGDTVWTVAAANTTDESLMLTGLQPQTNYEVRVRALCGDSYLTASFTTECSGGYTDPVVIGTPTAMNNNSTNYTFPITMHQNYSYSQQIYKADEIGGATNINNLSIQYTYSFPETRNIDIYLGHTSKNNFAHTSDWVTNGLTLVYSGEVTFTNQGEDYWMTLPFDSAFAYNGTDNLIVAFYDHTGSKGTSAQRFLTHTANDYLALYNSSSYSSLNPSTPGSGYRYGYRDNLRIPGQCISGGCDRANVAVTDITDSTALLHFTAGDGASGIELQYKRSVDSTFTTVAAAGSTLQLTGLYQNTKYIVRIRSLCTGSQSTWKVVTFTTPVKLYPRIYVSVGGTGDGGSWATAAGDLNWAVSTAAAIRSAFDVSPEVWVAEGVYYGDGVSADAFTMVEGVDVYGGFAGTETELSQSNLYAHPSILDGQHSQRVLNQPANFTVRTAWDGFTIRNGYTTDNGGGAQLKNKASLYNCTIIDNTASNGGGVYAYASEELYTINNVYIENCQFKGNVATASGSGYNRGGGGLYANVANILRCSFTHNVSNFNGGGIFVYYSGFISNCLIANNTATDGGGVYNNSGNTTIENSTIVNNSVSGYGAGLRDGGPIHQIRNSIFWGNRTTSGAVSSIYQSTSNPLNCQYTAVEGGYDGEGNVALVSENTGISPYCPRFVNPSATAGHTDTTSNVDWHLQIGSVCVNRGNNSMMSGYDNADLDYGTRILHDTVDMGCYESNYGNAPLPQYGNIIYVTEHGAGTQYGDSWANAVSSIAEAQALAQANNAVVWVAAGTYYGNSSSDNAFTMVEGVSVYGGFAGNEPDTFDLDQRDFVSNTTILDGQNLRRVLGQPTNFTAATAVTWDGFTIQNGRTSGYGAGVYLQQYAILSHCIVQNNTAYYSSSTGESVTLFGAGVFSYITLSDGMSPNIISDCIIRFNSFENHSSLYGRGAGLCTKGTKIIRTEICHNTGSQTYGGGIFSYPNDTLSNCSIHDNSAERGGGIYCNADHVISNCFIYSNSATHGGGLYCNANNQLSNCLLHSNSAQFGGGIFVNSGSSEYTNCDLVKNTASSNGGGIYNNYGTATFTNCLFWGNIRGNNIINSLSNRSGYYNYCTYCAVEGGYDGTGNLNLAHDNDGTDSTLLYVRFIDPTNDDFQLQPTSVCIDAGNSAAAIGDFDLLGNPRLNGTVDIGCYEVNNTITEIVEATACDSYTWNDITYTVSGDYVQTFTTAEGIDSVVTLHLTVNYSTHNVVTETACVSFEWHGTTYTTSGTYTYAYTNADGCESTDTLHLTVNPVFSTSVEAEICEGSSYGFFDTTLITAGTYMHTLQTIHGCDSVIMLTLTVKQPAFGVDERAACDSLTWLDGVTYYESTNTPTYVLSAANGCDSIITLHLTIANVLHTNVYESACDSFTWIDVTYYDSGEYTKTFTTTSGCDSIVTLHLTVNQTYQTPITASICQGGSYNFFGQTLTTAGTYTHTLQSAHGCDSVITLTLTVNSTFNTPVAAEICQGGSYNFFGQTLTTAGTYTHTLQSVHGCDSVITLTLTVNSTFNTPVAAEICQGGSYNFFGQTLTTAGTYTHTLQSVHGCDSVITLTLTVNSTFNTPVVAEICQGGSYTFFGQTLTTAGTYTHTLQSVHGCDSVITLTLTVSSTFNTPVAAEICQGGSYNFFGQTLTTAGTYTHTLQTVHGCDSVITLTLTVNPTFNTPVTAEICQGGSYSFFGQTLTTAGTYTHTLQSVHGCDSVITLTLTVNTTLNTSVTAEICEGSSYNFFGQTLTTAGTYTHTLQSVHGCDSVITLTLTVNTTLNTSVAAEICEGSSYNFFGQ